MKPEQRFLATALVAAIALWLTALPCGAQNDTVTISAAEFQRMVYSGHVLTQFSEKPELDASLQVLIELQRRNPHADPAGLAEVSRQALQRYRTNAPAYIRTIGSRDEILAAYLDALRQVPARTNFVPATLSLLNHFMLSPDDYTNASPAELIHLGNQRLLAAEGEAGRQQTLLDICTGRAGSNGAFAQAMDGLLLPETLVSLAHTPAGIIGNTNSALYGNPTMLALLALSAGSSNGSLTVSSNQLMTLFTNETQTLWDTIHTNLALHAEINQSQPDLMSYLTNQPAIDANVQRTTAVRVGQARTIASATAAILIQSKLMEARADEPGFLPKLPKEILATVDGLSKIAKGVSILTAGTADKPVSVAGKADGMFNILAGGLSIYNTFSGDNTESPEETIVREIGNIKTLLQDLSVNINYRFDRVDQSLTTIFETLNDGFDQIAITLDAQGRQIATLNGNVDQIRGTLVDVQTDLHRLERHLQSYITELDARQLKATLNFNLGYEDTFDLVMRYQDDYIPAETAFFTHARNNAIDGLSSRYLDRDYSATGLFNELTESTGGSVSNRLDQNLSYIKKYLSDVLGQPTGGTLGQLANPRDWFTGAYAYLQLAVENPRYFRQVNPSTRLDLITARGRDLTNFFRSLTFTGTSTNINSPLYGALLNHYSARLTPFLNQVQATEQQYAADNGFALDAWRQWDIAAPRVTATATEVLTAPEALPPIPREAATHIAAGFGHSLALKTDGTFVGWGDNTYSQNAIPAGLTNLLEIAAGGYHNLALKAGGTVVGWGRNTDGQTNTPASATNVEAIAAGDSHSLALKADGTVVAWGRNDYGQTNVPVSATNVEAIAAGWYHNLAVKEDGTVVGWGAGTNNTGSSFQYGQAIIPAGLTNVEAISAGARHSLALKEDGTVVGWGDNSLGQTNRPAGLTNVMTISAGAYHSLALKADGTIVAWGDNSFGQTRIPTGLTNVMAIEAGYSYSLALKADGTVVAWGDNGFRQCVVPPALTWRGSVATSRDHILVLKTDGTVVGWGQNTEGQITIPASATNVVAIAAGNNYSLALKADGKVLGWGNNGAGQTTIPAGATNVVAIAAGSSHSVALKADGKVLGWGYNANGQTTIPASATNVVAVAAGEAHSLALKANGTVVGWGWNAQGQTTIPASATNVVAIAAGAYHNLALKADGKVVAWGDNGDGQTTIPASATNVVAIAAGRSHSLAFKADGTFVGWGDDIYGQTPIPAGLTNVEAIAAGSFHSLALKTDGTFVVWGTIIADVPGGDIFYGTFLIPAGLTNVQAIAAGDYHGLALKANGAVVGWGRNDEGQINIPASATNLVAIAAGIYHSLALKADGKVVAWGDNNLDQANIPVSATDVRAIAAGAYHNLALKSDGKVVGWGYNDQGQTTIPARATNVVAIAAGGSHSLALKADGKVVGWGYNADGQTTIPASATNVVAIAAGSGHSLALKADGKVVGWGYNDQGQTTIPASATNVVAIAAGEYHSLVLKADGTVLAWGDNGFDQANIPARATNVVAIAAGLGYNLLLNNRSITNDGQNLSFILAHIPVRVGDLLRAVNGHVLTNLGLVGPVRSAGTELSGAKALLQAVLELGMPYTMERDDVLHGFFYGTEALTDLDVSRSLLEAEVAKLQASPDAKPQALAEVAQLRYQRFAPRLDARLTDLAATGQPEIPRLVGHTLRLLNLLRDSWGTVPPSALETGRATNGLRLVLYGEPYARYTLQQSSNLTGWVNTSITNLRSADSPVGIVTTILPITGEPARFYRAAQPVP